MRKLSCWLTLGRHKLNVADRLLNNWGPCLAIGGCCASSGTKSSIKYNNAHQPGAAHSLLAYDDGGAARAMLVIDECIIDGTHVLSRKGRKQSMQSRFCLAEPRRFFFKSRYATPALPRT